MKIFQKIIFLSSVMFLSACGDSDNTLPPAELTAFEETVDVTLNWDNDVLDGVGQQYVHLDSLVLGETAVLASRQGSIIIIDLKTGDTIKQIDINSVISGGVGGNDEVLIVTTRNGEVVAVDISTMEIKWRQAVSSEILATPVVLNDHVVVKSSDGKVMALDVTNGDINWSYQQQIPSLTLRGSSTPVVARDKLFTGLENGRLVALSPINGEVMWDIALAVPKGRSEINRLVDIDGHAELFGQVLYASSFQGRVAAIDVKRGQLLWARPFSSNTGVSVDVKAVYSTDEQSHIWAIDRFSGATLWKQDKLEARGVTRPVIYNEYLLVGDYAGYIHVLSRFDGRFVARFNTDDLAEFDENESAGILVPPKVIGDSVLISARNGNTYSLSIKEKLN